MDDLVQVLREARIFNYEASHRAAYSIMCQAADRIEALEAALARITRMKTAETMAAVAADALQETQKPAGEVER